MKKQVFYLHGGAAFSEHDAFLEYLRTREVRSPHGVSKDFWSKKLRDTLGDDYEVFTPTMPNSDNAKYEEWKIWFERHFEFLRDDVVLVGWSQGALFFQKYLTEEQQLPFTVSALILVAPPVMYFKSEEGEDGADFNLNLDLLPSLAEKVPNITVYHSKDDFVVPYEHAVRFKEALPSASLVTFEDRNHFLQEEFPELVAHIKGLE